MKTYFSQRGFHLIEIMICVAIIAIISMIAIPNYQHHLLRARRSEAEITMSKIAAALEEYHIAHDSYTGATLASLGFSNFILQENYRLELNTEDQHYVLHANPKFNDTECGVLTLNSEDVKSNSGKLDVRQCW